MIDDVGELVCTQPMPSMPLMFWGDDRNRRYLVSYFDTFPGVWRHGDWLRITPQRRLHHLRPQRRDPEPPWASPGHQRDL